MAGKSKAKALAPKRDPNKLVMPGIIGEPEEVTLARTSLLASVKGAVTIKEYSKGNFGELDVMGLVEDLTDQAKAAIDGNLKRAEGMLMIQASTLDTIFRNLSTTGIKGTKPMPGNAGHAGGHKEPAERRIREASEHCPQSASEQCSGDTFARAGK